MTPEQLQDEVKRVLEIDGRRTQGEWSADSYDRDPASDSFFCLLVHCDNKQILKIDWPGQEDQIENDVQFSATAPAMMNIIRTQQALLVEAREALDKCRDYQIIDEIDKIVLPVIDKLKAATGDV